MIKYDVAVDFGSANIKVFVKGVGKTLDEPTILLCEGTLKSGKRAVAYGREVYATSVNEVPNATINCPIKEGKVLRQIGAVALLKEFISRATGNARGKEVRIICAVSCGLNAAERYEIETAFNSAGYGNVFLTETPIGAHKYLGQFNTFTLDIGADVTDVALCSDGRLLMGYSINVGGNLFNVGMQKVIAERYGIIVDISVAEQARKNLGSIYSANTLAVSVSGVNEAGALQAVEITTADLFAAVKDYLDRLVSVAELALDGMTIEFRRLICASGLTLCGGASNTGGIAEYLSSQLGISVSVADSTSDSVILGLGLLLDNEAEANKILRK